VHDCKQLAMATPALQGRARRRRTSSLVTAMGMLKRRSRSFFFSSSAARSACAPWVAALTSWNLVVDCASNPQLLHGCYMGSSG
jgi:hypothetical protein